MRLHLFTVAVALAISSAGLAQVVEPPQHDTVEIVSGTLHLKGSLWRPAGPGPFPAVVFNHGRSDTARQHHVQLGLTLEQVAQALGPVFVKHGLWDGSPELRDRLIEALRTLSVPVMLIQAANDYSLSPSSAMESELSRLSKPHVRKIYPAFGDSQAHGHNFLYFDIARWEQDVFAFLEANVTRRD